MSTAAIIIPALNEEKSIGEVVKSAMSHGQAIVVDDGSHDATAAIARAHGALVVQHAMNQGYDAALSSGLQAARKLGYCFVVTVDADGQHKPEYIGAIIRLLNTGNAVVVGKRSKLQRPSEHLFALAGRLLWQISDPLCGMKGYHLSVFPSSCETDQMRCIGTSLALQASVLGLPMSEIPIDTPPRPGSSRFGAGFKTEKRILKNLLQVIREYGKKRTFSTSRSDGMPMQ